MAAPSHVEHPSRSAAGVRPGGRRSRLLVEPRTLDEGQSRRRSRRAVVLAVIGLIVFFAALIGVLTHTGLQTFDRPIESWFDARREPDRTGVMVVLALLFGPVGMPIVVAITLVVWIVLARHLWRPLLLLAGMVTGVLLAQVLAPIIRHPRPPIADMLLGPDHTFSFPSGHVLGMSDFFLITAYLLATRVRRRWFTVAAVVVAVGLVVAQVVSRLYLGYHWFTDVTGSIGLSMAIVAVVVIVDTRHTTRRQGDPERPREQAAFVARDHPSAHADSTERGGTR
ncbi:phosphatase PAP2 family protein [Amnibacterium kyonggiense]|uniref:Undecaprenyl-diphosphatase n=1 Tax=Amnibacterium kyonggiense TaxID=595671 RepID=A0A4R7FRE2_9MICO|nr:phosphatase PAP2 family protein [Amnibacterium kyonggiense]TDS80278.1 undecaprenyl-diphosphatase [Amnibacterium kyonggiense]